MDNDRTFLPNDWPKERLFILLACISLLLAVGCSSSEEFTGTISNYSFFVQSENNIPFYAIDLSEIPGKTFIIEKENIEKFGFEIINQSDPITLNGRKISISNVWFDSASTEYIGKKVTIRAKSKVYFKNNDGSDIENHFEVIEVDWME